MQFELLKGFGNLVQQAPGIYKTDLLFFHFTNKAYYTPDKKKSNYYPIFDSLARQFQELFKQHINQIFS